MKSTPRPALNINFALTVTIMRVGRVLGDPSFGFTLRPVGWTGTDSGQLRVLSHSVQDCVDVQGDKIFLVQREIIGCPIPAKNYLLTFPSIR